MFLGFASNIAVTGLIIYLVAINIISFVVYGMDKRAAIKEQWRVPEKTLLFLAAIGGSVGAALGMKIFHHKTKKIKFVVTVPVCMIIHVAVIWALFGMN